MNREAKRRQRLGLTLALSMAVAAGASEAPDRAALGEQVRAAEVAFAASVAADDRAAFASFIDPDAVFVGGQGPTVGREAIVEAWKGYFGPDRAILEWEPEIVELSGDGTIALTRGPWTYRAVGADGAAVELSGLFNSVWRLQGDGTWRVIFDAGCSPCPACAQ